MPLLDGLWGENAEAWKTYHLLCGRTVRDSQLDGWLLDRLTTGWDLERVTGLLDRLDVIGAALESDGHTENRSRS